MTEGMFSELENCTSTILVDKGFYLNNEYDTIKLIITIFMWVYWEESGKSNIYSLDIVGEGFFLPQLEY